MIEDRTGRIWCGTTFGVYSVNPNDANPALAPVDAGLEGRKPPYSANVWALAEDLEGAVWIGLEDGTLHRRFPDGHVEHYTQAEGIIGKPGLDSINDLLVDRKGRLWIATKWGIYRLIRNPHLGMNVVEYQPKLPITKVTELFEARNGDIWAAMFQWLARFPRDGGPLSLFNVWNAVWCCENVRGGDRQLFACRRHPG
jgi:ligand-binding sensor domain-containing protein